MTPFRLKAPCKDYLWGGTKLRDVYGKNCDYDIIAESWELSCHKDGQSVIANGEFEGKTLAEYIDMCGKNILGKNCEKFEYFPILIKFIDAKDKNVIVKQHGLFMYGETSLGATDESVILFFKIPENKTILDLIKRDTYPEFVQKVKKADTKKE